MTIKVTDADYLLAAGQTLSVVDQIAVESLPVMGAAANMTIAGKIVATATPRPDLPPNSVNGDLDGVFASSARGFTGGQVVVDAGADLHIDATGSHLQAAGVWDTADQDVLNYGDISVSSDFSARGVLDSADAGSTSRFVNAGAIVVTSTHADATGADLQLTGASGENTGLIQVSGYSATIGVRLAGFAAFTNSGQIIAHDTLTGISNVAVNYVSSFSSLSTSFVNSGYIEGHIALNLTGGSNFPTSTTTFQNSGQVVGVVNIAGGLITVTNSGTITGPVNFGTGADLYDSHAGTTTGLVSGGAGDDTLIGGAGFDNLQGNQGDDSLAGGAGNDVVVGGKDNDVQHGDDGDDVVWGNLGNDTLDGGNGADQVRGGQGDDSISGGGGNDFVSGDRGNDTISGGAGADLFHGSQDAGIDRVLDFSQAEGDRVQLDPGTTYTLSQVGADTVIDMGASGGAANQMILVGVQLSTLKDGWIFEG